MKKEKKILNKINMKLTEYAYYEKKQFNRETFRLFFAKINK